MSNALCFVAFWQSLDAWKEAVLQKRPHSYVIVRAERTLNAGTFYL